MEIILKKDIKGLGYKDDIVKVKPGYGRNYLIPKKLGIIASDPNKKVLAEKLKQAKHKLEKIKEEARVLAESIANITLIIEAKAGESGKIFGSVTPIQISNALREKGFDVDRNKISFQPIKMVGKYQVILDLHKEIQHEIEIDVVAV